MDNILNFIDLPKNQTERVMMQDGLWSMSWEVFSSTLFRLGIDYEQYRDDDVINYEDILKKYEQI